MKWVILSVVVLVSACYWTPDGPLEPSYGDGSDYRWDLPEHDFNHEWDVMLFVASHVSYMRDIDNQGKGEYWQTPAETYYSGVGDCEDYTILAMYLLYTELGVESNMILGWPNSGGEGHAWVEIGEHWWEPQVGLIYHKEEFDLWSKNREVVSYGEAMYRAKNTKR